jgi:hypothetical protein
MSKLVYGVGVNDADYKVKVFETIGYVDGKQKQKLVWVCPFYHAWTNMLARGYSEKYRLKRPTYKNVTVCEQWHLFSTFKRWMEEQDYEGKQLDKDILVLGNKEYNPATCVFVSQGVNSFLIESDASRGECKIGCCWHKANNKFMAQCNNPFTGKNEYIGYYTDELAAHEAWLTRKIEYAYALAAIQTDERVAKALIDRYENYEVVNV